MTEPTFYPTEILLKTFDEFTTSLREAIVANKIGVAEFKESPNGDTVLTYVRMARPDGTLSDLCWVIGQVESEWWDKLEG